MRRFLFTFYSGLFCKGSAPMQLQHFGGGEGLRRRTVLALHGRILRQLRTCESPPNQIAHGGFGRARFVRHLRVWPKASVIGAGLGLVMLCASAAPLQAQGHAEPCLPLIPPDLPSDAGLMREFEDLLREEFEHYLSEVTLYFRCIDDERARAWREAAEVTAQYGAFLEALRRAPP